MAITIDDPARLEGVVVRGHDGRKLGTVEAVYYDNATDRPLWVTVRTGLFGTHVSVTPLADAAFDGSVLRMPYDRATLRSAPHRDPGGELSPRDEEDLYRHYGMLDDVGAGDPAPDDGDVGVDAGRDGDEEVRGSEGPAGTRTRTAERPRRRKQAAAKRTKNGDSAIPRKKAGTRTRRRKRRR